MKAFEQRIVKKDVKRKIVAFRRAREFFAKLQAIAKLGDESQRRKAIVELGPYVSRGKGKSRSKPGREYGCTNKFIPHQGKQEVARRLARGW